MKFSVKSFFLWILLSSATANNAYLRLLEAEVPRVRRSGTTVCVEVRPTSSQQEPYYMCKGGEAPSVQPTATFRPFSSSKSLPAIKPRSSSGFEAARDVSTPATFAGYRGQSVLGQQPIYYFRPQTFNEFNLQRTNEQSSLAFADPNQQVWAIPRFPKQQTTQTQPVLQPALPTERALELHAQNAPYFAQTEKPFQTLQTQSRPNEFASFGTQKDHFRYPGQEQAPNSFIARQSHGYSEQDQRSSYRSRYFGEPSQSSGFRYSSTGENDSPVANEQFPHVPTALDQLVTMDRPTYEPFTGVARPNAFQTGYESNRQSMSDQDLSFGDVDFTKTPNEFPPNLIVDMTPEELRKILIQPTIPAEFRSDPVLRTFYSSVEDQNALARSLQGLLKENESEFNEYTSPTISNNKQTAQQPETKSACPSCERNTDDTIGSFNVEQVSSQAPCPNSKDFNWPPVVIAMPCCGQQANTPSTPPLSAAGFYNPFAMPMMGMYPSLITPYTTAPMDNTNYAQAFQHQNYQNMPQMSGSQSRAANPETQTPETTTVKTSLENAKTEISITEKPINAPEEVQTERTSQKSTTVELKTDIPNSTAETTTTTESNFEEPVTDLAEAADTLKLKDDIPKTFQTMLNRAKTFKELAEAEMKDETLNNDAKKGKRQNFKDANAALRTIAEVVAASNKRKYSTVIH